MSTNAAVVELRDVSLEYLIHTHGRRSLRDWLIARVSGGQRRPRRSIWALKNVSFACGQRERVAIVGTNGAGKTSLLRVIAGIFPSTTGTVATHGRVVPLLELGLGFHGEMTGSENVVLASVLLGKTRREARRLIDCVMEFAELADFRDVPLKYYSSGMSARLAFAIAMETAPDVLLLDEVFAVGDIHWIQRAEQRVLELMDKAQVVMMVSHNPAFLRRLCERAIYLDRGSVVADGPVEAVLSLYEQRSAGPAAKIVDNRASSTARLYCHSEGHILHVRAEALPLLGESWVGLFEPTAAREHYLGYRRVSSDLNRVTFQVDLGRVYQVRLYRWTPAGETIEASVDVDLTHAAARASSP